MRGEDASNTTPTPIPAQHRLTTQMIKLWRSFQGLYQAFAVSRRAEQLRPQRIVATAFDSVLRTEMGHLEPKKTMLLNVCCGTNLWRGWV